MTGEVLRELALRLVDVEMEGNRLTEGHRATVKRGINRFFSWMESQHIQDIREVGKAELIAYYRHLCSLQRCKRTVGGLLCTGTINGHINSVKKMFSALYRSGYLQEDLFYELDLGVQPQRSFKRRPFTEQEMSEFLEQIDTSTTWGLRDRALFELIYSSGLRRSEAASLTMRDIDLERREIIVHGKGSRDRMVPISEVARDFLRLYVGDRINRLDDAVFLGTQSGKEKPMRPRTVTRQCNKLLSKLGIYSEGRCAHAVRHSTATHLLDHGASIRHIQELLGHRNIDTTVLYTQVQTSGLQKIYRKYHPGEHELFEAVDEAYEKRLKMLVEGKGGL